jgi:hypothetical protein
LLRRHGLAELAATEVGVAREGDVRHLWKGFGALRLRHLCLVRGTSRAQEEEQHDEYDAAPTKCVPIKYISNGKPWRVHSAVWVL